MNIGHALLVKSGWNPAAKSTSSSTSIHNSRSGQSNAGLGIKQDHNNLWSVNYWEDMFNAAANKSTATPNDNDKSPKESKKAKTMFHSRVSGKLERIEKLEKAQMEMKREESLADDESFVVKKAREILENKEKSKKEKRKKRKRDKE
jgi:hypothetical protein